MVANHAITTAWEAYNLSLQGRAHLPSRLVELSMRSMSDLEGEDLIVSPGPEEGLPPPDDPEPLYLTLEGSREFRLVPIRPLRAETTVVGVDASSIRLGETGAGIIVALRGAVVWRRYGSCRYLRMGPLLFHVTEQNRAEIYNALRRFCLGLPERQRAPSLPYMPLKMANLFEQWVREVACSLSSDAILLLDGSLSAGPDGTSAALARLLELARANSNVVMAISKTSKLSVMGKKLLDLLNGFPGPCLLELGGQLLPAFSGVKYFGRVYVAKLSPASYPFRLDIDAGLPREIGIDAVRALVANDAVYQGYPEVLRLAHIMATFTAPEVVAMQLMLSRAYGLRIIQRSDVRKLLFGPFGTGGRGP